MKTRLALAWLNLQCVKQTCGIASSKGATWLLFQPLYDTSDLDTIAAELI
jgi:hypothetical protein